jgi:ABC-type antimicrobial peptide transport system permease subunit
MDISPIASGSLLPIVFIGIIFGVMIVVILLIQRSGNQQSPEQGKAASSSVPIQRLDYQQDKRPKPVISSTLKPEYPVRSAKVPHQKDIDLIISRKDLTESMVALKEKYYLDMFTIATADGLIFGSSGGDRAETDAAMYSEQFKNNPFAETTGVILFSLPYKGSELIGIIRTDKPLPERIVRQIAADTKVILNRWI